MHVLREEARQRQKTLNDYLYQMSREFKSEEQIREIALQLKCIYADGFRHRYAEFFAVIVEISKEDSNCELDCLSDNLERMRDVIERDYVEGGTEFKKLYPPLTKLIDHINLEIARYMHTSSITQQYLDLQKHVQTLQEDWRKTSDELDVAQKELRKTSNELMETQKKLGAASAELKKAEETMKSSQTDAITVIGIFAGIVMAFSGSIEILGNALTGMQNTLFFKSFFFILLCGFVISNVIFLMMYLIGKITERNIYAHCQTPDCSCGENGAPQCSGLKRIYKRLPYVFWTNLTFLALMLADVIVWYLERVYNFIP